MPRKIEIKGWVKDWSVKEITGLNDEPVKDVVAEREGIITKEVKDCVDKAHSEESQATWLEKTLSACDL